MSEQELVSLTIEGVEVSVPKGTLLIEAAKQAGVVVPHYCYHPGLPVAGVCRMCLVEVERMPKLQIACATPVAPGMVVHVMSPQALEARKGVLEFLLINHPLDCPICDQAGECELQDYVFQEGRARTRYAAFPKRFNPVEDFGGDVLYVPNRCILCTRCVRFMDHVAEDSTLNVSERGDRAVIGIHPGRQLDHAWAGNVVDLCPVGSLISKDFLHKARAWELDRTASVCTGCSQGCNVTLDTRLNTVVRVRPRPNSEVNRYFMCDYGRGQYRWMNRGDRIEAPLIAADGGFTATDWDHAIAHTARLIRGASGRAVVLASPGVSTEALFLARRLLGGSAVTGAFRVAHVAGEAPLPGVPNLALRSERAPNATGARLLGYTEAFDAAVRAAGEAGIVLALDESLEGIPEGALNGAGVFVYLGTVLPAAARGARVVLPVANTAEEDGTFVNRDRRVQRYFQAKAAPGMARPAWWVLGALLAELGRGEPFLSAGAAFDLLAREEALFAGLSYASLGTRGAGLTAVTPAGVGT
ncbi:MAG TPA: 2Fe-2S iron-sulfur cluster-binding protein [Gemmatimonadales bacterium]|nr:2Fe-2S iron-sulfur cluster-binding protein [Gemmatimonadales bacterium]